METCKTCSFFNFKVDAGNGAFGECLNPKNKKATNISPVGVSFENMDEKQIINRTARESIVYLNEDIMSCVNHEKKEVKPKQ